MHLRRAREPGPEDRHYARVVDRNSKQVLEETHPDRVRAGYDGKAFDLCSPTVGFIVYGVKRVRLRGAGKEDAT